MYCMQHILDTELPFGKNLRRISLLCVLSWSYFGLMVGDCETFSNIDHFVRSRKS